MEKNVRISDYDQFDYDYSRFWQNRNYENQAEKIALKKLTKNITGDWFIDIGGSFGRNIPLYYKKFHNCVLMDYSIKALKQARKHLKKDGITNVALVAANVYHLPFKDDSFDGSMMIRVLHHIEKAKEGLGEIIRILRPKGNFILEFPNKIHIKAFFRALFSLNFRFIFSKEPYLQPSRGNKEGVKGDIPGIIYNFHPKFIKKVLRNRDMNLKRKINVSFLRILFLKKLLPIKIMIFFEKVFQLLLSWTNITPSIIYLTQKKSEGGAPKPHMLSSVSDLICCPNCKADLERRGTKLLCSECDTEFNIKGNIYDLRYPRPQN
jgi:ubiquinone/menaquinone biosynthesis C-methylase UbiE